MIKQILLGLCILLFIPIVAGEILIESPPVFDQIYPERIQISSSPISIEACTIGSMDIYITNQNTQDLILTPRSTWRFLGIPASWISFSEASIVVEAGTTKRIQAIISVPCNKKGDKTIALAFDISAPEPFTITHTQTIEIRKTFNLLVTTQQSVANACSCTPLEYIISVKNNGIIADSYEVELPEYFTAVPAKFTLEPNHVQYVKVTGQYPCDVYGTKKLRARVTTTNTNLHSTVPLTAEIENCYNFSISGPESISMCAQDVKSIEYTITNTGATPDAFSLSEAGLGSLSGSYIELKPYESGKVFLELAPNKIGNYTQKIIAKSKIGSLYTEKNIAITISQCYALKLEVAQEMASVRRHEVCANDESFTAYITNTGAYSENVRMSVSATTSGITLEPAIINISQNETKEFKIKFNHTELENRFSVTINAQIDNKSAVGDSIKLSFKKASDNSCFKPTLSPERIQYSENESVLTIKNTGIRTVTYDLYLSDMYNSTNLSQNSVTLQPKTSQNLTIQTEFVDQRSNKILVMTYVRDQTYSMPLTIEYKKGFSLLWILIIIAILLLVVLLILLIVLGRKRNKKETKKKQRVVAYKKTKKKNIWWMWLVLLLLLLSLLLVGAYFGYKAIQQIPGNETTINETISNETGEIIIVEEVDQEDEEIRQEIADMLEQANLSSFEYQKMYRNTIHIIDGSKVFFDPDGDALTITMKNTSNITAHTKGSYVILIPDKDFYGVRYTQFTATDPDGLSGISPHVAVIVVPEEASVLERAWLQIRATMIRLFN